jgi:exodeoxyribonuclease III
VSPVKIATWNVNGFRAREAQFNAWIQRDHPDVVCLQELKATPEQLGETLTILPDYWSVWHGGPKGYSGVSVHLRKDVFKTRPELSHPAMDMEFRVVQAAAADGLTVTSVYVPNGGKDYAAKVKFLEAMGHYVEGALAEGRRLVLCGDMNVARADIDVIPKERKADAIGQRPDERALFEKILAHGMVDVARTLHPDAEGMFTWWPPWRQMRQKNQGWRIDYVLAASGARGLMPTACEVLSDVGTSDHAPVVATFAG